MGSAAATEAGHILCFTAMLLTLLFDASFPALHSRLCFKSFALRDLLSQPNFSGGIRVIHRFRSFCRLVTAAWVSMPDAPQGNGMVFTRKPIDQACRNNVSVWGTDKPALSI